MMTKNALLYARASALPAIAATVAFLSTPVIAQEAQPVTLSSPAPTTTTEAPAPAPEAAPVTTDTTTTTETVAEPDPLAPTATKSKSTKTVTRTTHTAAAKPAAAAPVRSTSTRQVSSTATSAAAAPAATTVAKTSTTQTSQSAVTPVVDTTPPANPAPAAAPAAKPANNDETLPIAGGALALLALGGAAYGLSRRRRHAVEDEWVEESPVAYEAEPMAEPEPVAAPVAERVVHEEQPKIIAPSAFAWERNSATDPMVENARSDDDDDRMPGESWVERAYRGPTANNPSVSLRNRLKRAAFFDKRERDVAAGKAKPVDMDAGLPEAMVEEREREFA